MGSVHLTYFVIDWWVFPLALVIGVIVIVASKGPVGRSWGMLFVIVGALLSILKLWVILAFRHHS